MGNLIFDVAGIDDISELVRLRIAYMIDEFGNKSTADAGFEIDN